MTPNIDPEFRDAIPALAEEERRNLEESILRDGCRDALVVWAEEGLLLDGHNRLRLCEQHGIAYAVKEVSLPDRDAALDWIDMNQLGRRNLTPDVFKLVLGRVYNRRKKSRQEIAEAASQAAWDKRYGDAAGEDAVSPGPTFEAKDADKPRLSQRLGQQHGVSRHTVVKAGQLAEAYDEVRQANPAASQEEAMRQAKETIRAKKEPRASHQPRTNPPLTGDGRAERIRELAADGHRAEQIAKELGHTPAFIRRIATDNDIKLHSSRGSRVAVDHERVISETIAALEGIATGLSATKADPTGVEPEVAREWLTALAEAMRPINKLARQLKEIAE